MEPASDILREREAEAAALAAAIAAAPEAGALAVIEGPPGIGKTALVDAARLLARDEGFLVLSARGTELEATVPFGVVRQLLDPVVLGADVATRAELFRDAAAGAESLFSEPAAPPADGADDLFPTLHGLFWLLSDLAQEQPLLLVVDDAHWADPPSLQLLAFLAPRLEDLRAAVVVATRPVADTGDPLLARLRTDPAARVISPAPLTAAGVSDWSAAALGADPDPVFVAACVDATGGNPFFVEEVLRELSGRSIAPDAASAPEVGKLAPGGVASMVMLRLAVAPEGARELAEAVAILGADATAADAAAFAGLEPERARAAADGLLSAGILSEDSRLAFAHPVLRAAVEAAMPAARVAEAHARAADLLRERGAPVEDIAAHLVLAPPGRDGDTAALLLEAASRALALGAPASALPLLERAIAETPGEDDQADLRIELARTAAAAGAESAPLYLRQAIERAPDARTRARAAIELARAAKYGGGAPEAVPLLTRCLDETNDRELAELLNVELLCLTAVSGAARDALRNRLAALRPPPEGATGPGAAHALAALAFETGAAGRSAAEGAAYAARVPEALGDELDSPGDWIALMTTAAATWCEAYELAERLAGTMIDWARRRGTALPLSGAASLRGWLNLRRGRLAEADADVQFALELARETHGTDVLLTLAKTTHALVAIDRGRPEGELRAALRLLEGDRPDFLPFGEVLHARGMVLLALGEQETALEALHEAGRFAERWGFGPTVVPWRGPAALALHRLGKADEARALAREDVELCRAFGARRALGMALRNAAIVSDGGQMEGLVEAVEVLEDGPDPLELARALAELGRMLRLARRPTEAREPLRRAAELAVRCGADGVASQAHDELLAAGARPRRLALSGVEALTPSERRVAELAAAGRSNREIAQELFVTQKTVEGHLSHAFDKLGIRSRLALGDALSA